MGDIPIPPRFQVPCHFCHGTLDSRMPGIFQRVNGWVMQRSQGGGNAIALPVRSNEWACPACVRSEAAGTRAQETLL